MSAYHEDVFGFGGSLDGFPQQPAAMVASAQSSRGPPDGIAEASTNGLPAVDQAALEEANFGCEIGQGWRVGTSGIPFLHTDNDTVMYDGAVYGWDAIDKRWVFRHKLSQHTIQSHGLSSPAWVPDPAAPPFLPSASLGAAAALHAPQ